MAGVWFKHEVAGVGSRRGTIFHRVQGTGCAGFRVGASPSLPLAVPFLFLQAAAFQLWCWTAPASPRRRSEKKEKRDWAEPSRTMWTPSCSCGDHSSHWSCSQSPSCSWNHQALQSCSCKVQERLPWCVSEPCQVPPSFVLSLCFHCVWAGGWGREVKPWASLTYCLCFPIYHTA